MRATTSGGPSVAIIGAGFGGIAMGARLIKAGITDFTIFDSWGDVGGTWLHNTYPGAAVDTPSHMYSFSFRRHEWSSKYATQAELLDYLRATAKECGLEPHLQLNTEITQVHWDDRTRRHRVVAADGREWTFDVVVSAVGILNIPMIPTWEGREEYGGTVVHTARWDPSIEWAGKRVAVVGTGSSAAQVIPAMAPDSAALTVFMRQPVWVDEKDEHTFTSEERRRYSTWWGYHRERYKVYVANERNWLGGRVAVPGSRVDRQAIARCSAHMRRQIADPDLLRTLTPRGPYMAKRPVRSAEYLPALQRDNVRLVPRAVERFYEEGLIDSAGEKHPVDIVVTATGFRPAEYIFGIDVTGRAGANLHDTWGTNPQAFLGVDYPGFPNFFMLLGPNSNYYAIVFNLERQADFVARVLRHMRRSGSDVAEVRTGYFRTFNRWLTKRLARSSFAAGENYFRSASGTVVTQWPEGAAPFWLLTKLLAIPSTRFTTARRDAAAANPGADAALAHPHDVT